MPLFRKDSAGVLSDMQSLLEQMWHAGLQTGPFDGQDWAPPVEMIDRPDRYLLFVELPGVERSELDVSCTASQLSIHGQKVRPPESSDHSLFRERRFGSFSRSVPFAEAVVADQMTARLDKGVLEVTAPKKVISSEAVSIQIQEPPPTAES